MKLQTANLKLLTAFAALCCLLPQARASGSWIVDGEVVQTLEVTVDDPDALHTDGTRTMDAPLVFDSTVSSAASGLFKATVPWDIQYDFFAFNETYETIVLSPSISSLGFEAANLVLHGGGVITHPGEGTSISFVTGRLKYTTFGRFKVHHPRSFISRLFSPVCQPVFPVAFLFCCAAGSCVL